MLTSNITIGKKFDARFVKILIDFPSLYVRENELMTKLGIPQVTYYFFFFFIRMST